MESKLLDALARSLAQPAQSRRQLIGVAVAALLGAAGAAQFIEGVDAAPRCPKDKKKCGKGCCPGRAPKCCKTYCCRKGFSCCGNKKCCK